MTNWPRTQFDAANGPKTQDHFPHKVKNFVNFQKTGKRKFFTDDEELNIPTGEEHF